MNNVKRFKGFIIGLSFAAVLSGPKAYAVSGLTLGDISSLSAANIESMIDTVSFGTHHRAFGGGRVGKLLGIEAGVEAVFVSFSSEFLTAIGAANAVGSIGNSTIIPKLNIRKSLPAGLAVGFSYVGAGPANIWGFDLQYTLPLPVPKITGRFTYSKTTLWFIESNAIAFDGIVSIKALILEPYLGVGFIRGAGSLDTTLGTGSLSAGVSADSSTATARIFGGLVLDLFILKISGEYSKPLAAEGDIGVKVAIAL